MLAALSAGPARLAADPSSGRPSAGPGISFTKTEYPRIAMLWSGLRGSDRNEMSNWAKHDFVMVSPRQIGMIWDGRPEGLADRFTPESVDTARRILAELRRLNPDIVILADNSFYEYRDGHVPEDHPWWLRKNGQREQFWPGTHRMDWNNRDYQEHVLRRCESILRAPFDGLFFDNLRNEPAPWIAILGEIRRRLGDDILLMANAGYATDRYDFAAPFLNGFMYESGWSHNRTEWDSCIQAMQHSATLMREPRINLIERFEEIGDRAGWPSEPGGEQKPPADPAARRWSLGYSLVIGDHYFLFSDNTSHRHDWFPEYDVKIGHAVSVGRRVNAHVWEREYDRALVVVNLPGAKEAHAVETNEPSRDVFTGERGNRFLVPPGDARILRRDGAERPAAIPHD